MKKKQVEIWVSGKLLCITSEDNPAIEDFERIVKKAGYSIDDIEVDYKIVKMI